MAAKYFSYIIMYFNLFIFQSGCENGYEIEEAARGGSEGAAPSSSPPYCR